MAATVLLSGRIQCDKNGQVIQLDKDTVHEQFFSRQGLQYFWVFPSTRYKEYSNPVGLIMTSSVSLIIVRSRHFEAHVDLFPFYCWVLMNWKWVCWIRVSESHSKRFLLNLESTRFKQPTTESKSIKSVIDPNSPIRLKTCWRVCPILWQSSSKLGPKILILFVPLSSDERRHNSVGCHRWHDLVP